MREWDLSELEKDIEANKIQVEKTILSNKPSERLVRRRPRDREEQRILDQICIQKWRDAEKAGKIKYISKNEWYYEI